MTVPNCTKRKLLHGGASSAQLGIIVQINEMCDKLHHSNAISWESNDLLNGAAVFP